MLLERNQAAGAIARAYRQGFESGFRAGLKANEAPIAAMDRHEGMARTAMIAFDACEASRMEVGRIRGSLGIE